MSTARACISFLVLGLLRLALVRAQNAPPPIIAPRSGDIWPVGSTQTIKWSAQGVQVFTPAGKPIPGTIWLGHLTNSTSGFWLWVDTPLADGFALASEEVQIIVPNVPTASDYFIAMDISNNLSQLFTIQNPDDPKGTSAEPSTISVSTLPISSFSVSTTGSGTTSATGSVNATSTSASSDTSGATSSASSSSSSSASNQSTATVLTGTNTKPTSASATSSSSGSPSSSPTNAAVRAASTGLAFFSSAFAAFLLA
ncbi:hypothetical protein PYCCODRAFT_1430218 [Trametes coccinea BRFM310]|uniref:Ser-Thr-rich glycosyl-phosphatidyl-inositol-anchored membrane family-domain-containing protein n=1 Tax=Trametes coccinea (strain BRFM310) TaxID=1353009 RepID=A0A1Y2J3N8_TRAC3|nr:hypothetical protein PYCCODRAFT_1430218 [Trametes coccinea BRFM310]